MEEEKLPHGVSSESMARWNNMDRVEIRNGLWALSDWLKYNTESAWRNEHRLLSDHDYTYYHKVLERAKDELEIGEIEVDLGRHGSSWED